MHRSDPDTILEYYRGLVAGGSDYVGYSEPTLKRVVIETVLDLPGDDVLEAGAGPNPRVPIALALGGRNVTAVEISEDFCATARLNAERAGAAVQVICAPAHALPVADASQDIAIMTEVLEHIPDELELPTLHELRRVVRDGGHLVISVPNDRSLFDRWNRWRSGGAAHVNDEHLRTYTHDSLTARVEMAGFAVRRRLRVPASDRTFAEARGAWLTDRLARRPEGGIKAALVAQAV